MLKRAYTAILFAFDLSSAAAAQGNAERQTLLAYLETHECSATKAQIEGAFFDAGLDPDRATSAATALLETGDALIVSEGNLLVLQVGNICGNFEVAPDPFSPVVVAELIAAYENNLCVLELESPPLDAIESRHSKEALINALSHLANNGQIAVSGPEGYTTTLSGTDICKS